MTHSSFSHSPFSKLQQFVSNYWYPLVIGLLLVVAVATRMYQLGVTPHGMTWDEAAIGYNGFAIWTLRRDEWVRFMPISFQSFGDYKAPLAIYLNGLFTFLFGMNLTAVRIPFALTGVLAVLGIAWCSWLVARLAKFSHPYAFSAITATLLTLSPWHIHFSRAGFESGMATSFLIWGVAWLLFFVAQQQNPIVTSKQWVWLVVSNPYFQLLGASGFFVASMYTYHSAKIVTPLLVGSTIYLFWPVWRQHLSKIGFLTVLCGALLLPMGWDSVYGPGATRLAQTSIFSTESSVIVKASTFISNYLAHFNPAFLMMGQTTTLRHGTGNWGVLYPTTVLFFIVAIVSSGIEHAKPKKERYLTYQKLALLGLCWVGIGILPAALGADEVPHSNRALLALPGFLLAASAGLLASVEWISRHPLNQKIRGNHGEKNTVRDAFIGIIILLYGIFFFDFIHRYFTDFKQQSSAAFQDGYLDAMEVVKDYERGINGKPQVEKIMFSSEYGQPYIYALFSRKTDPRYYQGGSLIKYEFTDLDMGDFERKSTLLVASQANTDFPIHRADHLIYGSDGSVRFHLYYLP